MIQAHGFPKEYFFSVTNKGVGGLLKRWGEGASMIRGEWKQRGDAEGEEEESDGEAIEVDTGGDDDGEPQSRVATANGHGGVVRVHEEPDAALDSLLDSLGSLSLVPTSIRFGRGGKKGGFLKSNERGGGRSADSGWRGRGRGSGRGRGTGTWVPAATHVDL